MSTFSLCRYPRLVYTRTTWRYMQYQFRKVDITNDTFTIPTVINIAQHQLLYRYHTQSWTRSQTQFNAAVTSSHTRPYTSSHRSSLRSPVVQRRMLVLEARGRRSDTPLLVPNVRGLIIKTIQVAVDHSLFVVRQKHRPCNCQINMVTMCITVRQPSAKHAYRDSLQ